MPLLAEHYKNALGHGILNLDSHSKEDDAAFFEYYIEREKALQNLKEGHVNIEISYTSNKNKGTL